MLTSATLDSGTGASRPGTRKFALDDCIVDENANLAASAIGRPSRASRG